MQRHVLTVLVAFWLAAGVGLVAAGDSAKEAAIKKDRAQFKGTWRVVSLVVDGNKAPDSDAQKIIVTNHADGTWVVKVGDKEVARGTSTIDPTKKPKTLDFVPTVGSNQGKTHLGLYELKGDSRKLCFVAPGKDRPTEFSSTPGSGHILVVFRRDKK